MDIKLFWILLIILQAACLFVSFRASKKHISNLDYYSAGKSLTFFPLLMTFIATQVGGGLILGSAEEAYVYGWKIIFYPLGSISGFFLLSSFLGRRLSELPVTTVAQIFEVVYGSKNLKKVASFLSMLTLLMITVAQVLASQKFLACFQLDNPVWFMLFWAVILLYTMWGGMSGIASIDVIQAFYFLIALSVSLILLLLNSNFSFDLLFTQNDFSSSLSPPWTSWFFMPCLFMLIEQDMAQRCFSAKSSSIVKKAALGSAFIIFFIALIPIIFGLYGKSQGIVVPSGSSVLMTVIQATNKPFVSSIVACAIMMAIISTAVSLIHSISSNLIQDFEFSWNKNQSSVWISKLMTFVIGCIAIGLSYFFKNIVNILIQSYELSVVCLFVPVFMSLFSKKRSLTSALFSIGFGLASFIVFHFVTISFPREIIEIGFSALGYWLGSFWKESKTQVNLEKINI